MSKIMIDGQLFLWHIKDVVLTQSKADEILKIYKRISAPCAVVPISAIIAFMATVQHTVFTSDKKFSCRSLRGMQGVRV
jgi:hypothetical protein